MVSVCVSDIETIKRQHTDRQTDKRMDRDRPDRPLALD